MDGIAIRYKSFESGNQAFPIEKVAPAGSPQQELIDDHSCIEVMTGAILPKNTDTVIKYEELLNKETPKHPF
jgi:molybdopterin molybdotransferase